MNILFIHTNPYYQEIDNLVNDIVDNIKLKNFEVFQLAFQNFKCYDVAKLYKIRRYIKENKIDVVHAYHYVDAYYILMACKFMQVKVIYSSYFYHDDLKGVDRLMHKYVLSHVNTIIFQTNVQKDYMVSKYNLNSDDHFKLLHAFSAKRLDDYKSRSIRDEFFIDDYRYLIGTKGDYTPDHDVLQVFKMVRKLRKTGRNFTCVVAGDYIEKYDDFYNECRYYYLVQGLDNYITYANRRSDSINFISQLDAFVYHSDHEAVALPVLEAMVSGTSVVVNDNEMIREITNNGKYASLYKSDDSVDFASKTREILSNIEDSRMIAEVIKEECRTIFSIEKHILGLRDIYNHAINK